MSNAIQITPAEQAVLAPLVQGRLHRLEMNRVKAIDHDQPTDEIDRELDVLRSLRARLK